MDSGHIIKAALSPETVAGRLQAIRSSSMLKPEPGDEKGEP